MISIKTEEEVAVMREGGRLLAKITEELQKEVCPGITTDFLDKLAEEKIRGAGAIPAFKGYEGFPKTLCASVNEEIVHIIPSDRVLIEGDMLTLDLGLVWKGWHLDMARTLPVGKISPEAEALLETTKRALEIGIAKACIGNRLGDIAGAIQQFVEKRGYGVVRELCGHGIGRELHEDPKVLNYGQRRTGPELVEGMVLCIEPMITAGDWHLKKSKDGYGFETQDGSLSCHFEDTIAITATGPEVLTRL